jgi:ABC-2 type transport system ATP-binding protein
MGLNDVTLSFDPGVTGLLGPNGAGKSTLLKILSGQLRPSQGEVQVFGRPVFANPWVMARLGMCPEHEELYESLSGREHLHLMLRLGGFGPSQTRDLTQQALRRVTLTEVAERRVSTYSKGMRQRLRIAAAIAHDPALIILDEPLTGLDPVGRREMIDLIRELGAKGHSLILSGHVLHEVEKMTRRIVLIHHGQVLAEGTLAEIRAALDRRPHHVEVGTPEPRKVATHLLQEPGVLSVRVAEEAVMVETRQPEQFFERLMDLTIQSDPAISHYRATDDNLQAIFDYLVG